MDAVTTNAEGGISVGVYIKGMEMPISCGECCFFAWAKGIGQHCNIDSSITFHATIDGFNVSYERKGDCPLIAIQPHGRLIDAKALLDDLIFPSKQFEQGMRELIGDAPTIIEAEGEE